MRQCWSKGSGKERERRKEKREGRECMEGQGWADEEENRISHVKLLDPPLAIGKHLQLCESMLKLGT